LSSLPATQIRPEVGRSSLVSRRRKVDAMRRRAGFLALVVLVAVSLLLAFHCAPGLRCLRLDPIGKGSSKRAIPWLATGSTSRLRAARRISVRRHKQGPGLQQLELNRSDLTGAMRRGRPCRGRPAVTSQR
jgi:hypothetical protein